MVKCSAQHNAAVRKLGVAKLKQKLAKTSNELRKSLYGTKLRKGASFEGSVGYIRTSLTRLGTAGFTRKDLAMLKTAVMEQGVTVFQAEEHGAAVEGDRKRIEAKLTGQKTHYQGTITDSPAARPVAAKLDMLLSLVQAQMAEIIPDIVSHQGYILLSKAGSTVQPAHIDSKYTAKLRAGAMA